MYKTVSEAVLPNVFLESFSLVEKATHKAIFTGDAKLCQMGPTLTIIEHSYN